MRVCFVCSMQCYQHGSMNSKSIEFSVVNQAAFSQRGIVLMNLYDQAFVSYYLQVCNDVTS